MKTFIHVHRVWPGRLGFRVWVDLPWLELARIIGRVFFVVSLGSFVSGVRNKQCSYKIESNVLIIHKHNEQARLQKILIVLQALCCGSADDGSYRSPLGGHQLGQMKELLLFFT